MFKKLFTLFAALTLCAGLWAETPAVGDTIIDANSGVYCAVTAAGETNTVKVIANSYTGTSYNIPATVTYNDVTFAVTEIGESAFRNCSALQSVTIPASVTTIGGFAFDMCKSLQSVTIPASVTTIGIQAFASCIGLQSITIPAGVTTIGIGAFSSCIALTSVTFLGNACQEGIAAAVFANVGKTTPALLTLPNSWTGSTPVNNKTAWYGGYFNLEIAPPAPAVGDTIIDATSGLKFEVTAVGEANTIKVIANSYTGTAYEIPATVSYNDVTFAVTEIGEKAFQNCSALQSVTIPASVTTIGANAFAMCSGLTSVTFLGNACQDGIAAYAFLMVGQTTPVLLTLPDNWGEDRPVNNKTPWHSGLFEYEVSVLGDQFVDATSGLKFEITAIGAANTVKVVSNNYKGTSYTVPATVKHKEVDFAVTEIGTRAFSNRKSLQSITIAASVTTIGESAFDGCSALTSVTLSEGLTTIGESAFRSCSKLTSITLPASVTTMGSLAFNGSGLESATFADGSQLTTIGASAFQNCSALKSVTFAGGSQLNSIGAGAFNGCSNLQTVILPATLKSIGGNAFDQCTSLTSIAFPASLDTIEGAAFFGCSALESITIPASVDTIGESAFSRCKGLTSIVVEAGNTKYDSRDNCNGIVEKATNTLIAACQNTIIPNTVTILGSNVFRSQPITTITIPASVTTIGKSAFDGCTALQSITIPAGVTTIGSQAFASCSKLTSITIPAGVTTIGAEAFYVCSALTSVTFLGNACQEGIGSSAFGNVGKTTPATLVLPNNWTGSKPVDNQTKWYGGYFNLAAPAPEVGDQFVDATSGLKFEVTAVGEANTVKVIFNDTYKSNSSYTVPDTVKYLDVDFAVTEIGVQAFNACSALQSITLPASVTKIGMGAFGTTSLTSITLPEGLTTIGGAAFAGCSSLASVTLPAGVTTIEPSTFYQCSSLQSITLPEGLTTIEYWAFVMSGLTSVTIPAGVTTIEEGAFTNCASLASVTFLGNACQEGIADDAFINVGATDPALLTLPANWTGTLPDEDGKWYGGVFNLREVPTALPNVNANANVNKFFRNGQLIIDANGKRYNAVGF